eukprot:768151-Hanusia_phi.AAC.2
MACSFQGVTVLEEFVTEEMEECWVREMDRVRRGEGRRGEERRGEGRKGEERRGEERRGEEAK